MNRLTGPILLQNQNARPFRVVGVIFDHNGTGQSIDNIVHEDIVRCEFFVAVERYPHLAARYEQPYLFQGLAQSRDPSCAGVSS